MVKRIIPISSGKGGVGKTSFAVNLSLCLAPHGKTVLIDLDTGTSSIRNVIGAPIKRDLYHFFKKGRPLADCITTLPPMLDPAERFADFGFVAAPMHMIHDLTNMNRSLRERLVDAINGLDARYVILDLKAGLDDGVLDFLPQSNSGMLVFTPNHPAATLAASDIAKAILFRKFREVFHPRSRIYDHFGQRRVNPDAVNQLLDKVEDTYDSQFPNIDALLDFMMAKLGDHPIVKVMHTMVGYFQVYYVLNRFDGVENSFQTAVKPFVENISQNVSQRIAISNLGWVIDSERYHRANVESIPFVLQQAYRPDKPKSGKPGVNERLDELYSLSGLNRDKPKQPAEHAAKSSTDDLLDGQLHAIRALFDTGGNATEIQNFEYILSCVRYLFKSKRVSAFGDFKILKRGELVPMLLQGKG